MNHVEVVARTSGYRRLTLCVDSSNGGAILFYEMLGYEVFKDQEGRTTDERLYFLKKELPK